MILFPQHNLFILFFAMLCLPCFTIRAADVTVSFQVDMNCSGTTVRPPIVTGPFSGWSGNDNQMTDSNGDDIWELDIIVPENTSFEYKYAILNFEDQENLVDDMRCGATCAFITDFYSYANRFVFVESVDIANPLETYGTCGDCLADETNNVEVTFSVDMSCAETTQRPPELVGPFNGWGGMFRSEMQDSDMDDVWDITICVPPGSSIEYMFAVREQTFFSSINENLIDDAQGGATCAPSTDYYSYAHRVAVIPANASILPTDTYGICSSCDNPPVEVNFKVDMNCSVIPEDTPIHITGPFNGWCDGCAVMEDMDGDNVWERTFVFPPDVNGCAFVEYLYQAPGFNEFEEFLITGENLANCSFINTDNSTYANRAFTICNDFETNDYWNTCSGTGTGLSNCETAIPIECGDLITLEASDCGSIVSVPDCLFEEQPIESFSNSLWYKMIGEGDTITISTCNSANDYEQEIHVYTGSCASLNCLLNDTESCEGNSLPELTFLAEAGTSYFIMIARFGEPAIGTSVEIALSCTGCPDRGDLSFASPQDFGFGDRQSFETDEMIFGSNIIGPGADIIYDAFGGVNLEIGFEVSVGSLFMADLRGCPD